MDKRQALDKGNFYDVLPFLISHFQEAHNLNNNKRVDGGGGLLWWEATNYAAYANKARSTWELPPATTILDIIRFTSQYSTCGVWFT